MRCDDAPAFRKANPGLALASPNDSIVRGAGKFQRDLAKVLAERGDVETVNGASEVDRRPPFADGDDFLDAVEVLGCAEADRMGRGPEHRDEGFDLVVDKRCLVAR